MKKLFLSLLIMSIPVISFADDLTFDSFEAAEAAAQKRAAEYQKKMDEHIQNINDNWEQQQKDLGADSSSPDITKITTRADGEKSSSSDASQNLENAVNSSVNKLKDQMVSSAGPNSTGFAGGGAGYQWKVKFVNGKYVLSDSYNEAEFGTGKSKAPKPAAEPAPASPPEKDISGNDADNKTVATKPAADKPSTSESGTSASPSGSSSSSPDTGSGSEVSSKPADSTPSDPSTSTTTTSSTTEKPSAPGIDSAPPNLPPPAIKLVIQHPTDFSEEVFSSNADSSTTTDFQLEKFKIPEDTRIKIAVEVSKDISPEDVSLVITDDEGERAPVTSARMKNYRHMFRVPSEDKYSASVMINDKTRPGNHTRKLMQVRIPVTKVDFESRTIDSQRSSRNGSSSSASMSDTSSSGGNYSHSNSQSSQQVDLSDLYSDGSNSANANGNTASAGSNNSDSASPGNYGSGSSNSGYSSSSPSAGGSSSYASGASADSTYGSGSDSNDNSYSGSSTSGNTSPGNSNSAANSRSGKRGPGQNNGDSSSDGYTANNAGNTDESDETTTSSSSGPDTSNNSSGSSNTDYSDGSSTSSSRENSEENGSGNSNEEDGYINDSASADNLSQGNFRVVSARDININDSTGAAADSSAGKKPDKEEEAITDESQDPFVMALSLRNEKHGIFQSFDFLDQSSQMSTAVPAGKEIIFSLTLSKKVDPASVNIKLFDGSKEYTGNIQTMGESFACVFPGPTSASFVQLTGKSEGRTFIYRLNVPVKK